MEPFDAQHFSKVIERSIELATLPKDLSHMLQRHDQIAMVLAKRRPFDAHRLCVVRHGIILVALFQMSSCNVVQNDGHVAMLIAETRPPDAQALLKGFYGHLVISLSEQYQPDGIQRGRYIDVVIAVGIAPYLQYPLVGIQRPRKLPEADGRLGHVAERRGHPGMARAEHHALQVIRHRVHLVRLGMVPAVLVALRNIRQRDHDVLMVAP
mmetsp:Transcript_31520/g.76230  ORF Transcript_31520/g.76230 Transcript_31520/m.76230 type:complete len:210 (-) Transcript_31520:1648-2277(-)